MGLHRVVRAGSRRPVVQPCICWGCHRWYTWRCGATKKWDEGLETARSADATTTPFVGNRPYGRRRKSAKGLCVSCHLVVFTARDLLARVLVVRRFSPCIACTTTTTTMMGVSKLWCWPCITSTSRQYIARRRNVPHVGMDRDNAAKS